MGRKSFSLAIRHLKRAIIKIKLVLLSLKLYKWRLATSSHVIPGDYRLRRWSFNGRLALCGCIEDEPNNQSYGLRRLQRTTSYPSENNVVDDDFDIDRRAEIFITNFRSQLWLERQLSWKLRYSFEE